MKHEMLMTSEAINAIEEKWKLRKDAVRLLSLVVAEWQSDPQSVKCFDLRIVREAQEVVRRLGELRGIDG